jgi:hypothetical protein
MAKIQIFDFSYPDVKSFIHEVEVVQVKHVLAGNYSNIQIINYFDSINSVSNAYYGAFSFNTNDIYSLDYSRLNIITIHQ